MFTFKEFCENIDYLNTLAYDAGRTLDRSTINAFNDYLDENYQEPGLVLDIIHDLNKIIQNLSVVNHDDLYPDMQEHIHVITNNLNKVIGYDSDNPEVNQAIKTFINQSILTVLRNFINNQTKDTSIRFRSFRQKLSNSLNPLINLLNSPNWEEIYSYCEISLDYLQNYQFQYFNLDPSDYSSNIAVGNAIENFVQLIQTVSGIMRHY